MSPVGSSVLPVLDKDPGTVIIVFIGTCTPAVFPAYTKVDQRCVVSGILPGDGSIAYQNVIGICRPCNEQDTKDDDCVFFHELILV
jgi:hypothetical protein